MSGVIYNEASIQAEYADGFILDETELNDSNPYGEGNTLRAILDKSAETEHGQMVRFTLFYKNLRYDIPWEDTPEGSRPIRYKKMEMDYNGPLSGISRIMKVGFGYQYNLPDGSNKQEVQEL